ncbi:hypothetical protein IFM89_002837 [Coptis chinensis]|uniref:peptidylprolyl isomerase n=1 Tax=Coptis chinensis TaxID=261450 RepID=A0A835H3Q7_9MAGN|nr:hypothetical protein IFM89_002837 [Coptis chinensis]
MCRGNWSLSFDVGVEGMHVGEQRLLVVPPELAYGSKGVQEIPPNATIEVRDGVLIGSTMSSGLIVTLCTFDELPLSLPTFLLHAQVRSTVFKKKNSQSWNNKDTVVLGFVSIDLVGGAGHARSQQDTCCPSTAP